LAGNNFEIRRDNLAEVTRTEYFGRDATEFRKRLVELKVDAVNWTITYFEPETGHYWLMDQPQSELHGGGPIRFRLIPEERVPK
jgi:hypothetical protein